MRKKSITFAAAALTLAMLAGCAPSAPEPASGIESSSADSASDTSEASVSGISSDPESSDSADSDISDADSSESASGTSSAESSESASDESGLLGLPENLNSPNMDEWSNVVDGSEYYLTEEGNIAKRNADGSGGDAVIIDGHSQTMLAMPEGILYTTDTDELCFSALDGSNTVKLDEDVSNGYTNIMIDDDYIYYYLVGDAARQRIIDRASMEQVEIPEYLVNDFAIVRTISGRRFYYFRSDDVFCSCDMNGGDEQEIMTYPEDLIADNIEKLVIVDGSMYVNDVMDALYKFPAGTTQATSDMKLPTPDGKDPQGFKLRGGEILCSCISGSYDMSYYKLDLDGNYIGDITKEEWDG